MPFQFNMGKRRGYIFTDKKGSYRAWMGVFLGIISLVSLAAAVFSSGKNGGVAKVSYGFLGLFAFLYSAVGLALGIVTALNKNYYKIVPVTGILLNTVSLACIGLFLYMGGYLG